MRPINYLRQLYIGEIELVTKPVIVMVLVQKVAFSESEMPDSQNHWSMLA